MNCGNWLEIVESLGYVRSKSGIENGQMYYRGINDSKSVTTPFDRSVERSVITTSCSWQLAERRRFSRIVSTTPKTWKSGRLRAGRWKRSLGKMAISWRIDESISRNGRWKRTWCVGFPLHERASRRLEFSQNRNLCQIGNIEDHSLIKLPVSTVC